MIYRRRTYSVVTEKVHLFHEFFHTYLLPNQLKNGAKLVGRWTNEVTALWQYDSMEAYKRIEEAVRRDALHQLAQQNRHRIEGCIVSKQEDFLHFTGQYEYSKQIIAVSAAITNEYNEVL
ncbi:NIPSNAP family protein [Bacillus sp. 165]|uniref:NIPSNAP family protein n=1 Tax=Bacillus sp. 165 TaxID=1529117 RepID=UPI001ADC0DE2|nr:NIPSNAP family protein [Bacillus sp. 165]MBO9128103.1 NIPSNAP family protein [Bacillus sp. 165]